MSSLAVHPSPLLADVVIVGAGPAGSALAAALASDGNQVFLIDSATFPRPKYCGGALSARAVRGLPDNLRYLRGDVLSRALLADDSLSGLAQEIATDPGMQVDRTALDLTLVSHAVHAGAHLVERAPLRRVWREHGQWMVRAGERTFRAHVLVGADGVFSEVRRQVFGSRAVDYTPVAEVLLEPAPREFGAWAGRDLYVPRAVVGGYGWVRPGADGMVRVGLWTHRHGVPMRDALTRFRDQSSWLREARTIEHRARAVPMAAPGFRPERNHCLLIGDAAGTAEAFWSNGIAYAFATARWAKQAIQSLFATGAITYPAEAARALRAEQAWAETYAKQLLDTPEVAAVPSEPQDPVIMDADLAWRTTLTATYWAMRASIRPLAPTTYRGPGLG